MLKHQIIVENSPNLVSFAKLENSRLLLWSKYGFSSLTQFSSWMTLTLTFSLWFFSLKCAVQVQAKKTLFLHSIFLLIMS